jgi:hypothetical protein
MGLVRVVGVVVVNQLQQEFTRLHTKLGARLC